MFICPVLERPLLLEALLESWHWHSHYPIHILIAHDDRELNSYLELLESHDRNPRISFSIYPNKARGTGSVLNYFYRSNPNLGYYGFIGEDCVLINSNLPLVPLANYWAISWPNDGLHGPKLCTHFVVGGELVRAVGWLSNPCLFHSFIDNSWHSIGQTLELLHYCPATELLHNHPLITGREVDHVNNIVQDHYDEDQLKYLNWAKTQLPQIIDRINV